MLIKPCISVIVPFYNASHYIKKCIECLKKQNIKKPFEIIFVNDGSTDNSLDIIKKLCVPNLKLFSLKKNLGPAAARNLGITKSSGNYIFFLDVDDIITNDALKILYSETKSLKYDYVFCDTKWIEKSKNQRKGIYSFGKDKIIKNFELKKSLIRRLYNPKHMGGPLSAKCRLLSRSLIKKNNIFYNENLRYLEDEIFMWDFLAVVKSIKYIRKQLYIYHVHPNVETAIVRGLNLGFPVSKFKIIKKHILNSLKKKGCKKDDLIKHSNQSLVYFLINVLISYTKSIIHKKVSFKVGKKLRRKIINEAVNDKEVSQALIGYKVSKNESKVLVNAMKTKSTKLIEAACDKRAKEILSLRRAN